MTADVAHISYRGPMSEEDYLALVLRIQQAMAIEPFAPDLVDVVKLLADWRTLTDKTQELLTAHGERSMSLVDARDEIVRLQTLIERHNDEYRECPVIEI